MNKSRKPNNFLKNWTDKSKILYTKQRSYHRVSLLKRTKKNYFSNLNGKDIVYSQFFWKTVKPSLSEKIILRDKINLSENGQIIESELEIAAVLKIFFSNIIENLET